MSIRPLPVSLLLLAGSLSAQTVSTRALGGDAQAADPADRTLEDAFVNWETPHVSPLALTPNGLLLLAVNTADNRLEVFFLGGSLPSLAGSVPVGLDPVSVRARTNTEVWVVNHVSDSVSIVDLTTANVVATLSTDDEPADVVFAGSPQRAFVSCSQANTVLVFDPASLGTPPIRIALAGEDPRAMAVDGDTVYVAIFESGNDSTVLGGGLDMPGGSFPPNVVDLPSGPYGGVNPPPNDGAAFDPPINPALGAPPGVSMIVKRTGLGLWMDDNGGDWTALVSGADAAESGRPVGWGLSDHDVALLDANTLAVSYADHLMNINMALAVNPASGEVTVVGTDSTNEIRYEPVLNGRFLRVILARVDASVPATPSTVALVDMNPQLDYSTPSVAQSVRDQALGDPRGIAWNASGSTAYVSGMGSNNVIVLDATGGRGGLAPSIEVGRGPTGVVVDEARDRVYVLNKFDGSISTIDTATELEIHRSGFFDPTPRDIRRGREFLYDTHATSGLGHVSCGSCHVDARMDRLAWDLGDPSGSMNGIAGQNLGGNFPGLNTGFQNFHPMKGPMTTQTLQDIIGKEPHHWRGDRDGIEEFNGAFESLLGDDSQLTGAEMQAFEDFLATLYFPPNPFRNFDNTLSDDLALPGHFTTGNFGPAGVPLANGDAVRGLSIYRPPSLLDNNALACATCHTLPTGIGTNYTFQGPFQPFAEFPDGPNGEKHHALVSVDGTTNVTMKIPQLRNLYEKVGLELTQTSNVGGFGFLHDGSVDSIARFVSEPIFTLSSDQDVADLVAFMLSFSGSDLPTGSLTDPLEALGPLGQDTHASVGRQVTLAAASPPAPDLALVDAMVALADTGDVGLVVKGRQAGLARGYAYVGANTFQSDRAAQTVTAAALKASAAAGAELTFTLVPFGTQQRIGIDRDRDGRLDRDELDAGNDPNDPTGLSTPGGRPVRSPQRRP